MAVKLLPDPEKLSTFHLTWSWISEVRAQEEGKEEERKDRKRWKYGKGKMDG